MIRDYFARLMQEVADHPEVPRPLQSRTIEKPSSVKRNHESLRSAKRSASMKQFASWFTHGVPGGAVLRREIFDCKRGAEVMSRVEAFFTARANAPQAEAALEHDAELEAAPAAWG